VRARAAEKPGIGVVYGHGIPLKNQTDDTKVVPPEERTHRFHHILEGRAPSRPSSQEVFHLTNHSTRWTPTSRRRHAPFRHVPYSTSPGRRRPPPRGGRGRPPSRREETEGHGGRRSPLLLTRKYKKTAPLLGILRPLNRSENQDSPPAGYGLRHGDTEVIPRSKPSYAKAAKGGKIKCGVNFST
jgi:hypothetical protein